MNSTPSFLLAVFGAFVATVVLFLALMFTLRRAGLRFRTRFLTSLAIVMVPLLLGTYKKTSDSGDSMYAPPIGSLREEVSRPSVKPVVSKPEPTASTAGIPSSAPRIAVPIESARPWESPDWKACLAAFRRTAKMSTHAAEQRLVDGKCRAKTTSESMENGNCAMEAVGPSEIWQASGIEVKLVCMVEGREVMVCTNKKGHYMDEMTSGMASDKRCVGFPDLLAIDMHTKGPNKALEKIFANRKPQSSECAFLAKKIRQLENDPRFDTNQSTREAWAQNVSKATNSGCDL